MKPPDLHENAMKNRPSRPPGALPANEKARQEIAEIRAALTGELLENLSLSNLAKDSTMERANKSNAPGRSTKDDLYLPDTFASKALPLATPSQHPLAPRLPGRSKNIAGPSAASKRKMKM